jgi:hypothetical protein
VSDGGDIESAQHLFISCGIFGSLLVVSSVVDWIFVSGSPESLRPFSSIYLFIRWTPSTTLLSAAHLTLICLGCLKERNRKLFRNSEKSLPQLLNKVKLYFYQWLKTMNITLISNYHMWWSN